MSETYLPAEDGRQRPETYLPTEDGGPLPPATGGVPEDPHRVTLSVDGLPFWTEDLLETMLRGNVEPKAPRAEKDVSRETEMYAAFDWDQPGLREAVCIGISLVGAIGAKRFLVVRWPSSKAWQPVVEISRAAQIKQDFIDIDCRGCWAYLRRPGLAFPIDAVPLERFGII
ncbi:MAG: hypothetical protein P4L33_10520 [Capsulimonadaceae bacterium]|nr:hypothetical protein [Capsulimonadaceae bacterium]